MGWNIANTHTKPSSYTNSFRKIFWVIIVCSTSAIAQICDSGIILESGILLTETETEKIDYVLEGNQYKLITSSIHKSKNFFGWGVFYSGKWNISEDFQIEIRPGVIAGQTFYEGIQFGLYLRRKFEQWFWSSAGFTTELHFGDNNKYVQHTYTFGLGVGIYLGNRWTL